MSDLMPSYNDGDLNKSVIDLEAELDGLKKPHPFGGIVADYRAGGVQRVEQLTKLIAWLNATGTERLPRPDPTEAARVQHAQNLAREGEEDRAAVKRDAENAKNVQALQRREDKREKKERAA